MSSPEEQWWSVRAGEYVLGTLRGKDLQLFEKILAHDTAIQTEVALWERKLSALNDTTQAWEPGQYLLPQILDRIRQLDAAADNGSADLKIKSKKASSGVTEMDSDQSKHETSATLFLKLPLWPALAALATAASLVLAVLLVQRANDAPTMPLNVDGLAVVLSDDTGEPYFLVETDYGNLRVRVTALAPPLLDETKNFQLWQALPDRSSVRPVALLPKEEGAARTFQLDSLIDGSDLFGVSIEPVGAQTQAGPTGPVVAHGDYLPTLDAD